MNGWQGQNAGLSTTGWMPVYNMASQMGYGQQQQPQAQIGPYGSAPPLGAPSQGNSPMGQTPQVQNAGGPDVVGGMPGGNYAFDGSGSDAGIGGQPVGQMQNPMQGLPNFGQNSMRPPMLSDFRNQSGLQIQGNPTSQLVGGGGIGSIGLGSLGSGGTQQK